MNPKPQRIFNKKLMNEIKRLRCVICDFTPCDSDHITTKGAGGDDTKDNLWPLCHVHHVERHKIGLLSLVNKYPPCRLWLENHGRSDILEGNS